MTELKIEYEKIKNEWLMLNSSWQETLNHWHDIQQQHFEHKFWQEIKKVVPLYLEELRDTELLIDKIKQQFNL